VSAETPALQVDRWTPVSRIFTAAVAAVAVALFFVPVLLGANATQKMTSLLILVMLAMMWNALAGYGGLVSVGQQAFIGIGAYGTVYLCDHGVTPYLAMFLSALFSGVVAVPVSLLMLRLRAAQFSIGMWVVAEAFALLVTLDQSLGGGTGTSLIELNYFAPSSRQEYTYWLTLGFTTFLLVLLFVLLRSRLGASLQAIRDDEGAAESVGVRVTRAKRLVFVLAAVGCGAAGSITLANLLSVQANGAFSIQYTALMIFMVLVGGLGTFEGPVLGAFILFGIQQQFADQGSWYLVGLGVVAILVTLLFPRGLWGALVDRFNIRLVPVGYHLRGLPTTTEQLRAATATKPPPAPE
jgi:ABC-type branched-subunit amino acid transport system permease subunit